MNSWSRRKILTAAGTLASAPLAGKLFLGKSLIAVATAADDLPPANPTLLAPPTMAPNIAFQQGDGTEHRLSEFLGWGMVVNFWATWCAPCVAEMPALAALSRALAPHDIAVMPLSSDRGGAAVVRRFFDSQRIAGLPVLLDPKGAAGRQFDVQGIPSTVIIDKKGRLRARLDGAADWSSPAVAARIRQLVG